MSDLAKKLKGNSRFTLERRLGTGGTGAVYVAWDRRRGENVALKTLHHGDATDIYRFKREFRTLSDVAHPNLVALYELFVEGEELFFTMELVDGVDFLAWGRTEGETLLFDEERLRSALLQTASGIQALHDSGKVHCDLKPTNVLVTPQGRAVILDFGVARDLNPTLTAHSVGNELSGTIGYMAPEQARGEPSGPAGDWYALGVILFESLTGRLPFDGHPAKIISDKLNRRAPAPSEFAQNLPEDLEGLCFDLLAPTPELRPSGSEILRRLGGLQNIQAKDSPARTDGRTELALIGRRREFGVLGEAFARSLQGEAVAVYTHGESGVGKTTFVQAALRQLTRATPAVVLEGRCYERELMPYKGLDGVLDSLTRYLRTLTPAEVEIFLPHDVASLTSLFPVLLRVNTIQKASKTNAPSPDRLTQRRLGFAALREMLTRIGSRQPLVMHIAALHWADADSIVLLRDLLRPPDPPPMLLIASFRREEIPTKRFLRDLLDGTGTRNSRELLLDPLSEDAASELVRTLLRGADLQIDQDLISRIITEAEGHPFFIEQLVDYLRSDPSVLDDDRLHFRSMLAARFRRLPEGAERLLQVLALAVRPLATVVAYEAAGFQGDERPLVAALRAARLVRVSGSAGQIELYHSRIRKAIAESIPSEEARRLHSLLAESLLEHGFDDPEALFEHFQKAGDASSAAGQAAMAAVKAEESLAYDQAVLFYDHVLGLGEIDERERQAVKKARAKCLANAGRPGEAAPAYLDAAQSADSVEAMRCRLLAAREYLAGGYRGRGSALMRSVGKELGIEVAASPVHSFLSLIWNRLNLRRRGLEFTSRSEGQIPSEELLRIDAFWVMAGGLATVRPLQAADLQSRHLLHALETGEIVRVARALALEAGSQAITGGASVERAAVIGARSLELARQVGDPYAEGNALLHSGVVSYSAGKWREAMEMCDESETIFSERCSGVLWELTTARRYSLSCLQNLGELLELDRRVSGLLGATSERGDVLGATQLRTRFNIVWLADNDLSTARRELDLAQESLAARELDLFHYNSLLARCEVDLYAGDPRPAYARLEEVWPKLRKAGLLRIQTLRIEANFLLGRVGLATADNGNRDGVATAKRAIRRLAREDLPYAKALAELIRGGMLARVGEAERSVETFSRAADLLSSSDMNMLAAAARRRRGSLIGGVEGRAAVGEAEGWLHEQGVREAERLTASLAPGFPQI